jgi:DNA-binding MarR family transcriptional regulator
MDRKTLAEKTYHNHRAILDELIGNQLMASALSEFSPGELISLQRLGEMEWVSMRELATACFMAPNTATGVVDRMVKKGLVQRRHSETDRRVVEVNLTPSGRINFEEYLSLHLTYTEGLLAALTDSEAEQYMTLLSKIVSGLDRAGGDQ